MPKRQHYTYHQADGFTLLEILLVVIVISILLVVVIIAINPYKTLAETRNSKRLSDVRTVLDATYQYAIDHNGDLPNPIDSSLRMIGTDATGCEIACGGGNGGTATFENSSQSDFNNGTYSDTQWNGTNNWVELDSTGLSNGNGIYTSQIYDAESNVTFDTIEWKTTRPVQKELPNNTQTESSYNSGHMNMTGNLVLFHMNESSGTITDDSGQGNDGSNNGAFYGANGILKTSLRFDGVNDVVIINDDPLLHMQNFTLSGWFYKYTGGSGIQILLAKQYGSSYQNSFALYEASNTFRFFGRIGASNITVDSGIDLPENTWTHFAATYDGSSIILYLNGGNVAINPVSGVVQYDASPITIGADDDSSVENFSYFFNGNIDEVAVFNRALSETEIQDMYLRGALGLQFQIRSCDDAACDTEQFLGPDGTTGSTYSELDNATPTYPIIPVTNLPDNQYFQYRANVFTRDASYSPQIFNTIITYSGEHVGATFTANSCVDLSPFLTETYLSDMPQDPFAGNSSQTRYAIQLTPGGRVLVVACDTELNQLVQVSR